MPLILYQNMREYLYFILSKNKIFTVLMCICVHIHMHICILSFSALTNIFSTCTNTAPIVLDQRALL